MSLSMLELVVIDRPPTHLLTFFSGLKVTQFVHNPGRLHAVHNAGQLFSIEGILRLQKLHFIVDMRAGIQVALVALGIGLKTPFVEVEESGADNMIVAV